MKYFKRLLQLLGKHKSQFLFGLFFAILKDFSFIFVFVALYYTFSRLESLTLSVCLTAFGILSGGMIVHFLFRIIENTLTSAKGYTIFKDYRLRVAQDLKQAPMGYFDEQHLGNIQGAMSNTMTTLENYTVMMITDLLNGFTIAILLTLNFFHMHWSLGALAGCSIFLLFLILRRIYQIAHVYVPLGHEIETRMNFAVLDMLRGMSVLRSFPSTHTQKMSREIQDKAYQVYEEKYQIDVKTEMAAAGLFKLFGFTIGVSGILLVLLTLTLGLNHQIEYNAALTVTVGAYIIFLGLGPLSDGAFLYVKVPAAQAYLDKVMTIPTIPDGGHKTISGSKDIIFEDVCFSYDDSRMILKNISFRIPEGSKTAVVGPSGSGKTTLVNLMARFWDVNSGRIRLGSHDIREYTVEALLSQMSMVFQDVYLFHDTIRSNLLFAKPDATAEEIEAAAIRSCCHDFIMKLPDGYDTVIGEGGATLSGGEKQRISIARALLKDSPIVLLDEATSSIDPENEYEILQAIDELCKGKTVISIAHRLSTVKNADLILVIEDGQLVQQGNHAELAKQKGVYQNFLTARQMAQGWKLA